MLLYVFALAAAADPPTTTAIVAIRVGNPSAARNKVGTAVAKSNSTIRGLVTQK
jgi:hypothetical protein